MEILYEGPMTFPAPRSCLVEKVSSCRSRAFIAITDRSYDPEICRGPPVRPVNQDTCVVALAYAHIRIACRNYKRYRSSASKAPCTKSRANGRLLGETKQTAQAQLGFGIQIQIVKLGWARSRGFLDQDHHPWHG